MNRLKDVLQVAQQLSNAATDGSWQAPLADMVDLLSGEHAMVIVHDKVSGENTVATCARMGEDEFKRFLSPEAHVLMAPFARMLPLARVTSWSQLVADRQFEQCDFYNEVVRPANGFYAIALRHEAQHWSSFLAVCRPQRYGDFDLQDILNFQSLSPFLSTSVELHQRLVAAHEDRAGFGGVLDRLREGVILVDGRGRPLFLNERARALAAESDGLTVREIGLTAATPIATRQLREAITAATIGNVDQQYRLIRPSGRVPLVLTLLPIGQAETMLPGIHRPQVAIFIKELDLPIRIDRIGAAKAFGLTPRETEIAVLLAGGLNLNEIAETLHLGRATVRSHLAHVFEKTEMHGQGKLVALIRSFSER